jgi:hypothetical protein
MKSNRKLHIEVVPPPVKTREQKFSDALISIEVQVQYDKTNCQNLIDTFAAKLKDSPSNAFEWSYSAFEAAARLRVAQEIGRYIEMGKIETVDEYSGTYSPEKIIKETRRIIYGEVMTAARSPERSTSQQHNLMSIDLNSARAKWLERFDRTIERNDQ